MAVTVQVTSLCTGDHAKLKIMVGAATRECMVSKADVVSPLTQQDFEEGAKLLIKFLKACSAATNWAEFRTIFSDKEVTL